MIVALGEAPNEDAAEPDLSGASPKKIDDFSKLIETREGSDGNVALFNRQAEGYTIQRWNRLLLRHQPRIRPKYRAA